MGKVTVIVSTKVSKKATERNLLKRRIRAILKENGLPEGELVIRANPGSETLSYEELAQKVGNALTKLKPHA